MSVGSALFCAASPELSAPLITRKGGIVALSIVVSFWRHGVVASNCWLKRSSEIVES